ncbi:MAG TPA: aspartate kinase [Gemmatimonadaceae bacterium]|jgi:aspartokinase/homoserine dehydrogenase 1|nr:aspartate kinase [Gemmatimonadaceae bacterium]
MSLSAPTIHKFGGTALADGASVRHAAMLIVRYATQPLIVTASAMAMTTNNLFEIARLAPSETAEASIARLEPLRRRYHDAWEIACDGAAPPAGFEALFADAAQVLRAVTSSRILTPQLLDAFVATGEQLSAHLVVGALRAQAIDAVYVDATTVVRTDRQSGGAMPDLAATAGTVQEILVPLLVAGHVPVVPGFIGQSPDGTVVTLGRGGTDLTSTTLAATLQAREVVLWKDVPGFLTANPRVVPDARVIPELHLREAAELAYYGATVLHPRALIPLRATSCVVRIRPFSDPTVAGTVISTAPLDTGNTQPVRALSAMMGQALVTVSGNGMLGVPGIAARTFEALRQSGISVSLIAQASSEHAICLGLAADSAPRAREHLMDVFRAELDRGEIDDIDISPTMATIAVVGLGMAGQPGVAARLFTALGKRGINIVALAQDAAALNISVVVDERDAVTAQRAIHDEFQLGKIGGGHPAHRPNAHSAEVILLGFGQIGRALGEMLVGRDVTTRTIRVVGVIDRSGYVFDQHGFSPERLLALVNAKKQGSGIGTMPGGHPVSAYEALTHMLSHALTRPILVDVTADETSPLLEHAATMGADLVLANKRPVGGDRAQAESLRAKIQTYGRRLLHEATVGAGLPILDTFAKLEEAGDTVRMIEGCPSGTMGYLFGEMGRGTKFSVALRGAMQLGYTEPDPRDDLSGADVARKGLILSRLLGFTGEFSDVRVESLVPADAATLSLQEFLDRLETYDVAWAERIEEARARGTVLRYRATATHAAVSVGLVEVAAGSSLGALGGTDNQFSFTTDRYDTNPLVITGPGAGPAVTAAGVLNDVLKLAGAGRATS